MIKATGLTKQFGRSRVLDAIDFELQSGERVAVLGLNGAGKTTLIRCLMGLTSFEGRVEVDGCDVRTEGRLARARLGYVPQRAPRFDGTLQDVVEFFTRLRAVPSDRVAARLGELGLALDRHGCKPMQALSGGMLQKAMLGLAVGADVPLLLLDEPTANLDARARRDFLRALRAAAGDTTILLATHRLADVEAVADRLLILHEGRIAFTGSMSALWARLGTDVTLWIKVPLDSRESARAHLMHRWRAMSVSANGSALGIRIERGRRTDILVELRRVGIAVEDFWTETPSLHDLLDGLIGSAPTRGATTGFNEEE